MDQELRTYFSRCSLDPATSSLNPAKYRDRIFNNCGCNYFDRWINHDSDCVYLDESIGSIASVNGYGKVTSSVAENITLTVGSSNMNTVYTGLIEDGLGVLSLAKYGESFSLGNATHSQANTYTGLTTIFAGTLAIYNSRSLGSTSGGTIVRGSGKLALYNNIQVGAEDLALNASGVTLSNESGNNSWDGPVVLGQTTTLNSTAGTLSLTQTMTGNNVSLVTTGAGSMTLSGILTLGIGGIINHFCRP